MPENREALPDRGECARLSARLETLRTEFDERIQAKDVALADQERMIIGLEAERDHLREAAIGTSSAGGFYCKLCDSPAWSRVESIIHDAECPMPPPKSPLTADEAEAPHGS